ncbi:MULTISPECIES: hypothetical protein [unclassified Sphingomonas]|uniref:hypothetical protein n=1 Tax=unclassified Sphingomonas TaxID=196159 RepID=UPI00215172ED|nr:MULTISPECIES: hypothetical protein [unclassified Sphingomonas]MCR5870696.1 hypothetical protein [Sphingomonas sp. J344]UUY00969.1 hypothetical protein LRS08_07915 [Sphingomonas sp. J315]
MSAVETAREVVAISDRISVLERQLEQTKGSNSRASAVLGYNPSFTVYVPMETIRSILKKELREKRARLRALLGE